MKESNEAVLHYEILQEKAQALGRAGRLVEVALSALRIHDEKPLPRDIAVREELVADAAEKAHHFLIQRELCGMRDWPEVAEFYAIPVDVLKRIGSCRKADDA